MHRQKGSEAFVVWVLERKIETPDKSHLRIVKQKTGTHSEKGGRYKFTPSRDNWTVDKIWKQIPKHITCFYYACKCRKILTVLPFRSSLPSLLPLPPSNLPSPANQIIQWKWKRKRQRRPEESLGTIIIFLAVLDSNSQSRVLDSYCGALRFPPLTLTQNAQLTDPPLSPLLFLRLLLLMMLLLLL